MRFEGGSWSRWRPASTPLADPARPVRVVADVAHRFSASGVTFTDEQLQRSIIVRPADAGRAEPTNADLDFLAIFTASVVGSLHCAGMWCVLPSPPRHPDDRRPIGRIGMPPRRPQPVFSLVISERRSCSRAAYNPRSVMTYIDA